jgi:hypothetical protein
MMLPYWHTAIGLGHAAPCAGRITGQSPNEPSKAGNPFVPPIPVPPPPAEPPLALPAVPEPAAPVPAVVPLAAPPAPRVVLPVVEPVVLAAVVLAIELPAEPEGGVEVSVPPQWKTATPKSTRATIEARAWLDFFIGFPFLESRQVALASEFHECHGPALTQRHQRCDQIESKSITSKCRVI